MKIRHLIGFVCNTAVLICASAASAQTDLLSWTDEPGSVSNPRPDIHGVTQEWPVAVNIRAVMADEQARSVIRVALPKREPMDFKALNIGSTSGFRIRDDYDYEPDPDIPDSLLSYTWYGHAGAQQMTLSVFRGRASATIQTDDGVFTLAANEQRPVLRQFDPELFLGDADQNTEQERHSVTNTGKSALAVGPLSAKSAFDSIDILIVHTPAALVSLGNDTNELNARISEAFQQLAQSFGNSGANTVRMRNVLDGQTLLSEPVSYNENSGWTCAGSNAIKCRWYGHRIWLRTDPTVQALRNTHGADLVVMLVADSGTGGVAYTQRPNCGFDPDYEASLGCGVGADYADFAYAVVWTGQMTAYQVFAHELGHQFGMEHPAGSATPSYSWSFGKALSNVQSMMGISQFVRSIQFSNPNVPFIGRAEASGESLRFNARTAYCLAPVMSGYRSPGQVLRLFWDGFEEWLLPADGC